MILDRDTDAISAAITSLQVVFGNLGVMVLWGLLLTALVVLALLPWGAGLIVVGPLLVMPVGMRTEGRCDGLMMPLQRCQQRLETAISHRVELEHVLGMLKSAPLT